MADWYCSSVQHAAVAQWAALTTYAIGAVRRGLAAPSDANARVWRVSAITTGISGAAEPTWNRSKGTTTTDAGVTWTEVTGSSTYNSAGAWTAPHLCIDNALEWAAGLDRVLVGNDHAYSIAASYTLSKFSSSAFTPVYVVCVNVSTGAKVTGPGSGASESVTGSTNSFTISNFVDIDSVDLSVGGGSSSASATFAMAGGSSDRLVLRNLKMDAQSTGACNHTMGSSSFPDTVKMYGVTWKFGAVGHQITTSIQDLEWHQGGLDPASSIPTILFNVNSGACRSIKLSGVDLSIMGSGKSIFGNIGSVNMPQLIECVGCQMDPAATWVAEQASPGLGRQSFISCGLSTGVVNQFIQDGFGNLTQETTIVRTGGTNDGATSYSHKIVTNGNCSYANPFKMPSRAVYNSVVNVQRTLKVPFTNDGTTYKDNEIWLEVEHFGNSGNTQLVRVTTNSGVLAAGSNLTTDGSSTWANGGFGAAVNQYVQAQFTPQLAGYIRYTLHVGKASKTLYADAGILS